MSREGVVHALRLLHRALIPGGVVHHLSPASTNQEIVADGVPIGCVNESGFQGNVVRTEQAIEEAVDAGLYVLEERRTLSRRMRFDRAEEMIETASGWRGVQIDPETRERAGAAAPPFDLAHEIRYLRLRTRAS